MSNFTDQGLEPQTNRTDSDTLNPNPDAILNYYNKSSSFSSQEVYFILINGLTSFFAFSLLLVCSVTSSKCFHNNDNTFVQNFLTEIQVKSALQKLTKTVTVETVKLISR